MPTSAPGPLLGRREKTAARRGGVRSRMVDMAVGYGAVGVSKAVNTRRGRAGVRGPVRAFAHRVGQGDQLVVLVGVGGKRSRVAHEFPPARCGDAAGMTDAQVPRVGFARGGQRSYYCRGVR